MANGKMPLQVLVTDETELAEANVWLKKAGPKAQVIQLRVGRYSHP
jgi:hypothetical protein